MDDRRNFIATAFATVSATILGRPAGAREPLETKTTDTGPLSVAALYTASLDATSLQGEAADRIALRELVDGWAHFADRRLPHEQAGLMAEDGVVEGYEGDPDTNKPIGVQRGRQELITALAVLNKFTATTHLNGQSTFVVKDSRAFGETYCVAYQVSQASGTRKLDFLSIRYLDDFVRKDRRWFFQRRKLIIDWGYSSPLNSPSAR